MINRLLFLLKSDKENNYYGGIRSLFFSYDEADYLKPYHVEIHDMLNALHEHYKNQCGTTSKNLPFEGLANLIEDAGMDLPFDLEAVPTQTADEVIQEFLDATEPESPAEEPVVVISGFLCLTAEAILANKDVFESFIKSDDLNVLFQLGQLGFDLNEVVAKKDKIIALLKAAAASEKAKAKLVKATEDMEKATAKFLKATKAMSA